MLKEKERKTLTCGYNHARSKDIMTLELAGKGAQSRKIRRLRE